MEVVGGAPPIAAAPIAAPCAYGILIAAAARVNTPLFNAQGGCHANRRVVKDHIEALAAVGAQHVAAHELCGAVILLAWEGARIQFEAAR